VKLVEGSKVETNQLASRERAWGYEFSDGTRLRGDICSEIWDGKSVHGGDDGNDCDYRTLKRHWTTGLTDPATMCLRNYSDIVSDVIKNSGGWFDCDVLAFLWTLPPTQRAASWQCTGDSETMLFVDVGANIGACTMQMLARQDVAQVVAFEPNPRNQFYLTSTALKNPGSSSKLALFPDALGASDAIHTMYMEPGNAGNTVLDKAVFADPNAKTSKTKTITLDEVFLKGDTAPYIHVMKMDAQGFEVKVLKGARQLLAKGVINAIHFELAPDWLFGQGTSPAELLSIFVTSGYDVYGEMAVDQSTTSPGIPLAREELVKVACTKGSYSVSTFFAVYRTNKTAGEPAEEITCN